MKITYQDVEVINSGLMSIIDEKMKGKTAIKLAMVLSELEKNIKIINNARTKIIEMHAKKDEDGEIITNNDRYIFEDEELVMSEMKEMMEEELDFEAYINQSDLETLEITPKAAFALSKITK